MSAREIIAVPIALVSLLFLLLALAFPFSLIEQSRKNAHRLSELQSVQAYLDKNVASHSSLPTDDQIQRWAGGQQLDLASSVSTTPLGCLNGFAKVPQDHYVVGFWAGEWSECLSSPSGATTLRPSVLGLLMSGLWIDLTLYLTLGVGLGWVSWIIGFRRPRHGS
jgi:hypothetical protein